MNINIFKFNDYRHYLRQICGDSRQRSGVKTNLAKAANTFSSYITKVLKDEAHLTLEQADDISKFLGHNPSQRKYFLLMIQKDKSGTSRLEKYFEEEMNVEKQKQLVLKNQMLSEKTLRPESEAKYYSHWYYTAVDVALTVETLQTPEALSKYFDIAIEKVNSILNFLHSCGLIEQRGSRYVTTSKHIHLANSSENISKHHVNWRIEAIKDIEEANLDQLHYSSVLTLAKEDFQKLKELFVDYLKTANKINDASRGEEVFSLNIDLFRVGSLL